MGINLHWIQRSSGVYRLRSYTPSQYILENLINVKYNISSFTTHQRVPVHNTSHKLDLVPAYWQLKRCQTGIEYWALSFVLIRVKDDFIKHAYYSFQEFFNFYILISIYQY